jgi:hypothetical protein
LRELTLPLSFRHGGELRKNSEDNDCASLGAWREMPDFTEAAAARINLLDNRKRLVRAGISRYSKSTAGVAESADASDLKSEGTKVP